MGVFKVNPKRIELQQLDKLVQSKIPSGMNTRTTLHRFAEMAELPNALPTKIVAQLSGYNAQEIRKQLNMIYVKHTLLAVKKMHEKGDCVSDNEITIAF